MQITTSGKVERGEVPGIVTMHSERVHFHTWLGLARLSNVGIWAVSWWGTSGQWGTPLSLLIKLACLVHPWHCMAILGGCRAGGQSVTVARLQRHGHVGEAWLHKPYQPQIWHACITLHLTHMHTHPQACLLKTQDLPQRCLVAMPTMCLKELTMNNLPSKWRKIWPSEENVIHSTLEMGTLLKFYYHHWFLAVMIIVCIRTV